MIYKYVFVLFYACEWNIECNINSHHDSAPILDQFWVKMFVGLLYIIWTNLEHKRTFNLCYIPRLKKHLPLKIIGIELQKSSVTWELKWNESGFRPPLCTYRLNWARRTFWGWWDDWDDTVLQTQNSKFEYWRSEAEHATSRSRGLRTILTFTRGWGKNIFCFFQTAETGNRTRTLAWKAAVLTTTLGPSPTWYWTHRCDARSTYNWPTRMSIFHQVSHMSDIYRTR